MKYSLCLIAVVLGMVSPANAADPAKPTVSLVVKRHLTSSDHDQIGGRADTSKKQITLRVVVTNVSNSTIEGATLSGDALVTRAHEEHEKVVKEPLKPVKLQTLKPNERITIDLGKIKLSEVEWPHRKFEEKLEEWKVVCKQGGVEIGQNLSDARYTTLEKESLSLDALQKHQVDPRIKRKKNNFFR